MTLLLLGSGDDTVFAKDGHDLDLGTETIPWFSTRLAVVFLVDNAVTGGEKRLTGFIFDRRLCNDRIDLGWPEPINVD